MIDYKKKYKEFYLPKPEPNCVELPSIAYAAVNGCGNPNTSATYQEAIEMLYGVSYTIKMGKCLLFEDYFNYVVPPLESLWKINMDSLTIKDQFMWTAMIRLPEFMDEARFMQAVQCFHEKKPSLDVSKLYYKVYEEGLCVQCMHLGSYDDEVKTIQKMNVYMEANGYQCDLGEERWHHEIYLSNPRRCAKEKLKTVLRHPVKKQSENT